MKWFKKWFKKDIIIVHVDGKMEYYDDMAKKFEADGFYVILLSPDLKIEIFRK